MISILFIVIAASAIAAYETLKDHFTTSIFSKLNPQFWNAAISHANKYIGGVKANGRVKITVLGFTFVKPVHLTDAWHPIKSVSIIAFVCAIVFYKPHLFNFFFQYLNTWMSYTAVIAVYGIVYNLTFSLLYTKLFIK